GFAGGLPGNGPALAGAAPAPPGAAGGFGGPGGPPANAKFGMAPTADRAADAERKRHAAQLGRELADSIKTSGVGNAATGGQLGDFFQYAIDHPVSLARQKSALLPIVGKTVEGARVSIYNAAVQP